MERAALIRRSRLGRRLRPVRWTLWWESRAVHLIRLAALAGLTLALAWFDLAPRLPGWAHLGLLAALAGPFIFISIRLLRLAPITDDQAARRLERDNGLDHRPLAALEDRLAQGDDGLWRAHLERMERLAETLKPRWPKPVAASADPYALRFAALLLVVLAGLGAGDRAARLDRFVSPDLGFLGLAPASVMVWVAPPAYTRLAATSLKPGDGIVAVPTGSRVGAVVMGGWGSATLEANDAAIPLTDQGDGAGRGEVVVTAGDVLAIRQLGRRVARWDMELIPDNFPDIAIDGPPEVDDRGRFRLPLRAEDDYGLARIWVDMLPANGDGGRQTLAVDLPSARPRSVKLAPRFDLTAHDWAGHAVRLVAFAEDEAGQRIAAKPLALVLPERPFHHPVARQLIQWRAQLAEAPRLAPDIAQELAALLDQPDSLGGDKAVVLALALTKFVLITQQPDLAEARELLWDSAVRIEDGAAGKARRDLEDAKRELDQALAQGADRETLARLLARYEEAVARRLAELMARQPQSEAPGADGPEARDLGRMLEELQDLTETADADAIRQKLDQLQNLLDGLEITPAPDPKALKELEALRELAKRQQELLDQSFRQMQELDGDDEAPPRTPDAADRARAKAGEKAQRALQGTAKGLSNPEMGAAADAMGRAAQSLGKGDWAEAAKAQDQALGQIKQGIARAMAGLEQGRGKGRLSGSDPLGRGRRAGDDGATKVPGGSDIHRAREILDELRRRAGDPRRPDAEMDYLHRLLKSY
jgi:uncharacterized protein (TIGR02302 family)